jgi:hypothetical protein
MTDAAMLHENLRRKGKPINPREIKSGKKEEKSHPRLPDLHRAITSQTHGSTLQIRRNHTLDYRISTVPSLLKLTAAPCSVDRLWRSMI